MTGGPQLGFPELAAIRLGFGLSPAVPAPDRAGVLASIAAAAAPTGDFATAAHGPWMARWQELRKASRAGDRGAARDFAAMRGEAAGVPLRDLAGRLARAVAAPAGFGERLVQFWGDHFTVRARNIAANVPVAAFVDEAIRPHLTGRFADMLRAATTHPAMLMYLDQPMSAGPASRFARRRSGRGTGGTGLNENLAREVIELHSLGAGADYAQGDVRELAELLTGLTLRDGTTRFRADMAEPGADRVLGRDYGGPGSDGLAEIGRALGDLAAHPATARHLARKLAVHFLTDTPSEAAVDTLAAVWRDSGGDLSAVHAALADHPDLAPTLRHKVRQPFDLMATGLRALAVAPEALTMREDKLLRRDLAQPLARMGQPWGQPVGPDGWPETAAAWITAQGLAARISWALAMPRALVEPLPDPRALLETALGAGAGEALRWAVPRAESAREGVALILASTEMNRR